MSECIGMDQDHYTGLDVICFVFFVFFSFFSTLHLSSFFRTFKNGLFFYFFLVWFVVFFCLRKCFECCSRQMLPPKKKVY